MKYVDYRTKEIITDDVLKSTNFLYSHKKFVSFFTTKKISILSGIYANSFISKWNIKKFIRKNNINMEEYEYTKYNNFNDFFTRKKKHIEFDKDNNALISPADSKLSVYKVDKNLRITIKNKEYTLDKLFDQTLNEYKNAYVLVFRLCVDDYHRYSYIDDGCLLETKKINGKYHTVNPSVFDKYKVLEENERIVSTLKTKNFGKILYMEVGALLVGRIINHNQKEFIKGEEKGYFMFGGSTIVILINNVLINEDIIRYNKENIEVKVRVGERIGVRCLEEKQY